MHFKIRDTYKDRKIKLQKQIKFLLKKFYSPV